MFLRFYESSRISTNVYHLEHYKTTIMNTSFHPMVRAKNSYKYFQFSDIIIDNFLERMVQYNVLLFFLINEPNLFLCRLNSEDNGPTKICG